MPTKLRAQIAADPRMQICARAGSECGGRITWEHAITYAGKQVQEAWAIIPLCWFHHLGPGLDKAWNIRFAMTRATPEDIEKYPRLKWL